MITAHQFFSFFNVAQRRNSHNCQTKVAPTAVVFYDRNAAHVCRCKHLATCRRGAGAGSICVDVQVELTILAVGVRVLWRVVDL